MTHPRYRRVALIVLTGVFLLQTWLVYSDPAGRAAPPLSERASQGWDVWHDYNCQSCHQVYGFGGFLGPDLTNVAGRLVAADTADAVGDLAQRLETVLTTGSDVMPAFHLDADEREALAAFFVELDRTGVGQVQIAEARPPRELYDELTAALDRADAPLSDDERRGRELTLEHGCIDCHLPNGLATFRAPDLTGLHDTVDRDRLTEILVEGLPEKGMPRLGLDPAAVEAVRAWLARLATDGAGLRDGFEHAGAGGSLLDLPWFEYR